MTLRVGEFDCVLRRACSSASGSDHLAYDDTDGKYKSRSEARARPGDGPEMAPLSVRGAWTGNWMTVRRWLDAAGHRAAYGSTGHPLTTAQPGIME